MNTKLTLNIEKDLIIIAKKYAHLYKTISNILQVILKFKMKSIYHQR